MQGQPLIFVEEKAILMESVMYVDFSEARPSNHDRRIRLVLKDGTIIIVRDVQAIDLIAGVFVPENLRPLYTSNVKLMRN